MRTLFITVGVLTILFGLVFILEAKRMTLYSGFLIGGVSLIIAGLKRYRGEWPTIMGIFVVIIGVYSLDVMIGNYFAHTSENLSKVFTSLLVCLAGLLLLCSGHKLHKYSMEIEVLRNRQLEV